MNDDFISKAFLAGVAFASVWLMLLAGFSGCGIEEQRRQENSKPSHAPSGAGVKVYHYQGCEYLKFDMNGSGYGAPAIHSATCCNPQHCKCL